LRIVAFSIAVRYTTVRGTNQRIALGQGLPCKEIYRCDLWDPELDLTDDEVESEDEMEWLEGVWQMPQGKIVRSHKAKPERVSPPGSPPVRIPMADQLCGPDEPLPGPSAQVGVGTDPLPEVPVPQSSSTPVQARSARPAQRQPSGTDSGFNKRCRKNLMRVLDDAAATYVRVSKMLDLPIPQGMPGSGFQQVERGDVECDICHKKFSHTWILRKHMQGHQKEKEFRCARCGSTFAYRGNLTRHRETCGMGSRYVCDHPDHESSLNFYSKPSYQSHLARYHRPEVGPPGTEYPCPYCDKVYKIHNSFMEHQRECPQNPSYKGPYPCPLCGGRVTRRKDISVHLTRKHKLKGPERIGQAKLMESMGEGAGATGGGEPAGEAAHTGDTTEAYDSDDASQPPKAKKSKKSKK